MKKTLYKNSQEIADILKILSNKERLSILCYIDKDNKDVGSIVQYTQMSQSLTSQYLKQMKLQGILTSEKKGRSVEYAIVDQQVLELMKELKKVFL